MHVGLKQQLLGIIFDSLSVENMCTEDGEDEHMLTVKNGFKEIYQTMKDNLPAAVLK